MKEVAECLSYEGMVSTTGCVEVTALNVMELVEREYEGSRVGLFQGKDKYMEQIRKVANHDAFKLLGVKINK